MSSVSLLAPRRKYDYERDPSAIYRQSFSTIRKEAGLDHLPEDLRPLAIRLIHACGMTDLVRDLAFSPKAMACGKAALQNGAPIFTDVEMVANGIIQSRLPDTSKVICCLNDAPVASMAENMGTTRSAAATDLWRDRLEGAIVAIGNAPTALFHILERIAEGGPKPALILGFPVGFVGAAESKQALAENPFGLEFVTVQGRRGGSAMAASAVNALVAGLVEEVTP